VAAGAVEDFSSAAALVIKVLKELAGTVKEILSTCVSVGCTVDGKDPKDLKTEIDDGEAEIGAD
jgi:hypothetical protein